MATFKESDQIKEVNDEMELVDDFKRRTPYWSYRTVSYKDYEPLVKLVSVLDTHLEKLFQSEALDDANGDALDCIIMDFVKQAFQYLKYQRVQHEDTNNNFAIRVEGDIKAYQDELKDVEKDLEWVNREYNHLLELYWNSEYGKEK